MVRKVFVWMVLIGVMLFSSCNNSGNSKKESKIVSANKILQQEDGTISMKIEKAACYHDMANPSSNTAEWDVVVSKSGRYDVWMSSATKDTTDLKYKNSVKLSILEKRFEARPVCDKVFLNSGEVSRPYFRADSFIGSLYIQDTGIYNVQIISEKIIPGDYKADNTSDTNQSKLLSVFLTPVKHKSLN